jgi:hypothetical protein
MMRNAAGTSVKASMDIHSIGGAPKARITATMSGTFLLQTPRAIRKVSTALKA